MHITFYLNDEKYLRYPHSGPQSRLNLAQVNDSGDSNHLQHPVPMVRLRELVLLLRTPRVCARAPTVRKNRKVLEKRSFQNNKSKYLRMLRMMMPSTWGSSTSFPSTSSRTSLRRSRDSSGFVLKIFLSPIFT